MSGLVSVIVLAANLWPVVPDTLCSRAEWFLLNRHLGDGYMDSCAALLAMARKARPGDARCRALSARYCIQRGEDAATRDAKLHWFNQARAVADSLRTTDSDRPEGHLWWATAQGSILNLQGSLAAALGAGELRREFERAVELDPRLAIGWYALACLYERLPGLAGGSLKKAEDCLRRGVAADPNYTIIRLELARVLARQGRTAEAIVQLERLLVTKHPTHPAELVLHDIPSAAELLDSLRALKR